MDWSGGQVDEFIQTGQGSVGRSDTITSRARQSGLAARNIQRVETGFARLTLQDAEKRIIRLKDGEAVGSATDMKT